MKAIHKARGMLACFLIVGIAVLVLARTFHKTAPAVVPPVSVRAPEKTNKKPEGKLKGVLVNLTIDGIIADSP